MQLAILAETADFYDRKSIATSHLLVKRGGTGCEVRNLSKFDRNTIMEIAETGYDAFLLRHREVKSETRSLYSRAWQGFPGLVTDYVMFGESWIQTCQPGREVFKRKR